MAAEVAALDKHSCPACGAQAEWHAARQKLICPFCGTESPVVIDRQTGQAVELDLATALRDLPDNERGWQAQRRSVQCQSCRAVMVFEPERVGQNCEFCGSPALVAYEEIKAPIRPLSLLPFKVDLGTARDALRRWWGRQWLAPNRLRRSALIDTAKGLYIPYWTFDAAVHCPWEAEAGHYYYVTVEGRDGQGRRVVRQERRVRWQPASGVVDHRFDDELVPATRGIPHGLLRQVEPFPTSELVAYDTAFLSGHVVEHYQVVLLEAAKASQDQMYARLLALCAAEVPGDTHRNLRIHPQYSSQTFKHILVPVYLLTYLFRRTTYQVLINGYTGTVAGGRPYSVWKIAGLVLLALVVILFVALANR